MLEQVIALARRLKKVGWLGSLQGLASGGLLALSAISAAFLAGSALDIAFHLQPWTRTGYLFLVLALACALTARSLLRSKRELGSEVLAARLVEDRFPGLGRSLSTAVEYGLDEDKTLRYSSGELVGALVKEAFERTSPVRFGRVISWRPLARAALILASLVVAVATYAIALPHMAAVTARRFFMPLADSPAPTWTVIDEVFPGDREVPHGEDQAIDVSLSGVRPLEVRIFFRNDSDPEWTSVEMPPAGERRYSRTLQHIVRPLEYRIIAGDASSRTYKLWPVEEPRVEALRVKLFPPAHTGLLPEELPLGTGDIRAPVGTRVEIRARVSPGTAAGFIELSPDKPQETARIAMVAGDGPGELRGELKLTRSGEYRVRVSDSNGRTSRREPIYRMVAVPDRPPQVKVLQPERDVMAARDQKVVIELEASDDWGITELGIEHNLSGKTERISVLRPSERTREAKAQYPLELALRGLRGGEIIVYYPYAIDNDNVTGPKETIGEVRFIRTYDEERYGSDIGQPKGTPKAIREVERLISKQMEIIRKTSDAVIRKTEHSQQVQAIAGELASEQETLRGELDTLIQHVEDELTKREPDAMEAMRTEELIELREASKDMADASAELRSSRLREASSRQAGALSHLSKTRRILLSESSSSGGVRKALDSAARKRESSREAERRRALEEADRELERLPPLLQRQEAVRRKLERLEDEPPRPGELERLAEEERRLAEEARASAARMGSLSSGEVSSVGEEPRRRLLEAARKMEAAAEAARSGEVRSAVSAAESASEELSAAKASAARSLRQLSRDALLDASGRAEELARAEAELAASQQSSAVRAETQEQLKEEYKALQEELRKLSARAEREGAVEAQAIRRASSRAEALSTLERMDMAARSLRGGNLEEAARHLTAAARALEGLAGDLRGAAHQAASADVRERAALARRAEGLASESAQLARRASSAAQDPQELAPEAKRLAAIARALADAARSLGSHGEGSPERRAERALERSERALNTASSEFARKDPQGGASSAKLAGEESARAAAALRSVSSRELAKALSAAADAAKDAAEQQEEALRSDAKKASDIQRAAARSAEMAYTGLSEASLAAAELGGELAELLRLEQERASSERIPERMAALARKSEGAEREAQTLTRMSRDLAHRLATLSVEASGDELEMAKAAAQDARTLARELEVFHSRLEEIGDSDAGTLAEMGERAQGLSQESMSLRRRLERQAARDATSGRGGVRALLEAHTDAFDAAEQELTEFARRLLRNQPARPTGRLVTAAKAYQVIGDGLIEKVERMLKEREYSALDDEEAPRAFREAVERYFRTLSED